jgi:Mg-chelatase subunit ChlD
MTKPRFGTPSLSTWTPICRPDRAALGAVRITFGKPATIRVEADATSPNGLLKLVGIDETPVAVASEAVRANPLEVALVLDSSTSMGKGSKDAALRQAVAELADTLMIDEADVKLAVVPFSSFVNVGIQNRTEPWLELFALTPDQRWDGCVRSRPPPLDVNNRAPEIRYPMLPTQDSEGPNADCPGPLTPLSADKSVIMAAMSSMVFEGRTSIPDGLMWGWNVLSPEAPFTEARTRGVHKAMVLMSDGENSVAITEAGFHFRTGDPNPANKATLTLCGNIKQAGIHLYTVAFQIPDQKTINVLRDCASDHDSAFSADNGTALVQAFSDIARHVQKLRLVQ